MSFLDDVKTCHNCGEDKAEGLSCRWCLDSALMPDYVPFGIVNKGLKRKYETEKLLREIRGAVVLARLAAKSGNSYAIESARSSVYDHLDPEAAIERSLSPAAAQRVWALYSYSIEKLDSNFSKRKLP